MGHALASRVGVRLCRFFSGWARVATPCRDQDRRGWFPQNERSLATGILIPEQILERILAPANRGLGDAALGWHVAFSDGLAFLAYSGFCGGSAITASLPIPPL